MFAVIAGGLLLAARSARAQTSVHTHDGFYLHLEGGVGSMSSSASQAGLDVELSGGTGEFAAGIGGALTPNLVLAGQFWGTNVSSPKVKMNGTTLGSASGSLGLSGIGLEITYYVMPHNFYVSAVPSFGTLTASSGGSSYSTKSGFAIKLAAGKEWWVSDDWGIGLNLQYAHSSNQDSDLAGAPTWGTSWFGVAFSATYN
jgi:hypothetical protein